MDTDEARKLTLARISDTEKRLAAGRVERRALSRRHRGAEWVEILMVLVRTAGYIGGVMAFASGRLLLGVGGVAAASLATVASGWFCKACGRLGQAKEQAGEAIKQDEERLHRLRPHLTPSNGENTEVTELSLPPRIALGMPSAPIPSPHPSRVEPSNLRHHGPR